MATTKPRITVSLTQRQYDVINTIARLGGGSMSAFIGEMLEAALPTLERMAVTFQKVKQAQDQERGRFLESMDRAQAALEPVVMDAVGQFDLFLANMEEASTGMADAPQGAPAAPAKPTAVPRTNRGVTPNPSKPPKSPSPKPSSRSSAGKVSRKK